MQIVLEAHVDGNWTRTPLAYREFNVYYLCISRHSEVFCRCWF